MPASVGPAVVVGAGQAGCQGAVSLRELGHRGRLVLVGARGGVSADEVRRPDVDRKAAAAGLR